MTFEYSQLLERIESISSLFESMLFICGRAVLANKYCTHHKGVKNMKVIAKY